MNEEEFTPRNYQVELMKIALEQNTIIFLPTGSGKTFIALMVLKQKGESLLKSYGQGGKISIILVNTVALVDQHADYITKHTNFKVGKYTGEMNLDFWPKDKWYTEYEKYQVLVMTSQILYNLVLNSYIDINKVNLLIFDECHRGVNDHSMRQIMKSFQNCTEQPRVLGLTATLLNGNCKPGKVMQQVRDLEVTYQSKVATVEELKDVVGYSTNPMENIMRFYAHSTVENEQFSICVLNNNIDILEKVKMTNDVCVPLSLKGLKPLDVKEERKKLVNLVKDLIFHIENLGCYGGVKACLAHSIQIERIKKHCEDLNFLTVLNYIQTTFTYVIELLNQQMVGYTEREKIYNCSSDQLIALIKIFKEFRLRSEEDLCCIIFTKRRFTAKVIYHILDALSKCDPEYSYIKANFMVGHNNNPYNDTRETMYIHKQNRQVLTSFANKEINVLVASNVLEEGVDIPKCTLVIKYDYPQDYRSYIQSKGRARHKKSLYYMMVSNEDIDKFSEKYQEFQMVETVLNDYLIGKNEQRSEPSMMDIEAMYNEDLIPPYYVPSTGAQINMLSAISTLCQYCSLLPSDVYTVHAPDWFIREVHAGKRVVILLPTICGILEPIEGPTMPNTKFAKRAAALKACIVLHKSGELDDHLLPIKKSVQEEDVSYLFTHYPEKKEEKAGNLKTRRLHEKLIPRTLSEPIKPDSTVNLHIIQLEPQFARKHEDIHLATLYDMYTSPICYGIITNAPLPTLCDFPIYVTLGTINVSLKVNQRTVTITEADLDNIKTFHVQVFDGVLEILKRFLMFDKSDNLEMMLLVPINKQQSDIDWNILKERIPVNVVQEPSNEEKYNLEVTQESHLRKIISPWHRRDPATYIVTEVCLNKNAHSPFPNEEYSSFIDYFKSKHNLQLRNPNLPLLLAKKLTKNLNFIKPKGRTSVKRKHDKMHVELEEYLPAELVVKQEFPASLWIQANFIPTILTRISFMLQLEELRCRIAKEKKGLGIKIVSVKQPLQLDEYLLDYEPYIEELPDEELMPANGVLALPQSQIHVNKDFTKKCLECQYPWKDIDEPTDIERNLDVSIMDIEHYESFIGCLTNETRELRISPKEEKPKALTYHKDFVHKKIHLLEMPTCRIGPELCELYKALTSAKANEIVNLERLETLGDSLLKLVVSIYIYSRFPQYDEGRATQLKGRLVSNRNLFYLALRKNLNGVIKYNELSPKEEWLPPAFAIPDRMLQRINNKELSLGALFGLNLSLEEQVSGKLNSETLDEIIDDECPPTDTEESNYSSMAHFLKSQYIGDKHIADVVESLIGVYFKTCGFAGGLKIIEWLGLIPESENLERIFLQSFPSPLLTKDNVENKIRVHLPLRHEIEEIIGYTFKNKAYLLQALTHSSYTPNRTTLSYEKLEFLGDAVLDFLITCHIYESCGNLDPGELTDLRSALVNNNTFASLVVRLGLHKYLLMINSKLQRLVDKFVTFMEQKNYVIDDEVMILLQEDEYQMAESVDVPKILGDIFEAIAGAIYLDSDNDLKTVWRVFYKIMWKEIDLFSQNVPKNVVRKLFEWNSAHPKFGKPTLAGKNKCMVPLQFVLDGIPALVHGFGANKAMARKAAAKLALQSLDKKNR